MAPARVKDLKNLPAALVKWQELARRYERRRADGKGDKFDDYVKTNVLGNLGPTALEMHPVLNRARLMDYSV